MADNRFDYPTAAAPTSSIVFTLAGHLVDDADTLTFNDEYAESMGGTDQVVEHGDSKDHFDLSVIVYRSHGSLADKADLYAFLNTVRRLNTFQWTDEAGTVRTVRNVTNPIVFEPFYALYTRVSLTLKEQ